MDEAELEARLARARLRVTAERHRAERLRELARDTRRRHLEALARASVAVDQATVVRLRRSGVPSAAPPVPSYPPQDLQAP